MKCIKNILMVLGLLLQVSASFASDADEAQAILGRINKERESTSNWEPTGPTFEDIEAATKVENLAAKGSQEDKLITALKNGDLECVKALISTVTNIEARDDNDMTALMIAAQKGYTDIVSRLINAGALVDAQDRYNLTALFNAIDGGHTEVVKLLIAHGAAKNQKDFGELFVAAVLKCDNEMVKALIVESARIGDRYLDTAYQCAQNKCSAEIVNAIEELQKKSHS